MIIMIMTAVTVNEFCVVTVKGFTFCGCADEQYVTTITMLPYWY